jgi:enoyl-CoA hydratase/carnithine racemase
MTVIQLSNAVTFEMVAPHLALVSIDRPDARNAVNVAVAEGIARAVESTERDADVWAVILTGKGGVSFCAGADLKEVAAGRAQSLGTEQGGFAGFVNARRAKPWIAAVEGFALGGGLEIALACEMVVASENSVFGLPEVTRGLIAAAGGVYRLPRVLPRNVAFELIATGAQLPAARAHHFGMVNQLAPKGQAVAVAIELGKRICACAPVAVRESLGVARLSQDLDDESLRQLMRQARERNQESADWLEGPRAFIEKRQPQWSGR